MRETSHYVYEPGSYTPLAQVRGPAVFRDGEAVLIHVDESKNTRIPDADVRRLFCKRNAINSRRRVRTALLAIRRHRGAGHPRNRL